MEVREEEIKEPIESNEFGIYCSTAGFKTVTEDRIKQIKIENEQDKVFSQHANSD